MDEASRGLVVNLAMSLWCTEIKITPEPEKPESSCSLPDRL